MNNPWKGLDSYTEEDVKQQYSFCGRTGAIGRLYSLITERLVSTLYGRTGCGKTSLLQAGVFPLLRQDSFLPVMCRASLRRKEESFASYIISRVENELEKRGFSRQESEVPMDSLDEFDENVLWKYMYGHRFIDGEGQEVFPVLILDQFEEILINDVEDANLLLRQLDLLAGDTLALPEDTYSNFRIVFSIREDFLFLLEDALDENGCSQLRDNRMRLTAMSPDDANEVIELGMDCFEEADYRAIKDIIVRSSRDKRGHISTNMLSLCCSQCFELFKSKGGRLTEADMKQTGQNMLRDFYLSCVSNVSDRTREYIEENLVVNGRRSYVHMEQFLGHVPQSDLDTLSTGKYKILQVITAGESQGVELIHDTLARTVFEIYSENKELIENERKVKQKSQTRNACILFGIELFMWLFSADLCIIHAVWKSPTWAILLPVNLIVFAINILYSLASYGKTRFSKLQQAIVLMLDIALYSLDLTCTESYELPGTLLQFLLGLLLFIPIINMMKSKDGLSRIGFMHSLKYVFGLKALDERPDIKPFLLRYLLIILSLSIGFLSLWFKNNWILWILFPVCTVMTAWALVGKWNEPLQNPLKNRWLIAGGLGVSLLFTISQFSGSLPLYLAILVLFAFWAFAYVRKYSEDSGDKRILRFIAVFAVCGLLLPHLFLGYIPSTNDYVRRAILQPHICYDAYENPKSVLAFRGKNGKIGVLSLEDESKGILFKPSFDSVDSLASMPSTLGQHYTSVYSGTEVYDWHEDFSFRGDSKLLKDRIEKLLATDGDVDWTEECFQKEAELAAAYRTVGQDSTALALEYDYFVRRMLGAEMRDVLIPSIFSARAANYIDFITIYDHQLRDSITWKGDYKQSFIELVQSNQTLVNRAKQYLRPLVENKEADCLNFATIAQAGNGLNAKSPCIKI